MGAMGTQSIKSSLCLCITTYKRGNVIKDFLEKCASYYLNSGIDIYIYDSSDDNETQHVLEEWDEKKKERVYYVRMPSDMHANMKVYKIWQFYGLKKEYDYIWMCGDSLQFSKRAVEILIEKLMPDYDMIELDIFDKGEIGYRLYTQPDCLFAENAWKTTLFGTIILNAHTILADVDWEYYEKKYSHPRLINYSHVSFYFNRAAERKDFQCMHLPLAEEYRGCELKKESGWKRDTFFVICEGWVTTIKEMPDCYLEKSKEMLELGSNSVLADRYKFLDLKKQGIYNLKVFIKYFLMWKKVCNIGQWELFITALSCEMEKKFVNRMLVGQLRKFKRGHKLLYLYGAGVVGERYGRYLSQWGIDYKGYVVTEISDDRKFLNGHKIIEIRNLKKNDQIGIVAAVSDKLSREVIERLQEYGYGRQIYYSTELSDWMKYKERLKKMN